MRYFLAILAFLVLAPSSAVAFERNEFELSIPTEYKVESYKQDLKNWVASLINGLGYDPNKVSINLFLRTDIPITVNGNILKGAIYQNKDNQSQFYVSKPKKNIVDFSSEQVGTMGVAGISVHPTPSGRMVVVLAPQKGTNILGVTLDFTVKTQVTKPEFQSNYVAYQW